MYIFIYLHIRYIQHILHHTSLTELSQLLRIIWKSCFEIPVKLYLRIPIHGLDCALIRVATDVWCNNAGVGEAIPPQGYDFGLQIMVSNFFETLPEILGNSQTNTKSYHEKRLRKSIFFRAWMVSSVACMCMDVSWMCMDVLRNHFSRKKKMIRKFISCHFGFRRSIISYTFEYFRILYHVSKQTQPSIKISPT